MSGRRLIIIVILSLAIATAAVLLLSIGGGGSRTGFVGRLVMELTAPLQSGITKSARGIDRIWRNYYMLLHIKKERDELLQRNKELTLKLQKLREIAKREKRLEKLLGFIKKHPGDYLGAEVIAVASDPLMRTVRIDRGRNSGVREYQAVLSADGLVGRVLNAVDGWSDVLLLSDVSCHVSVLIGESRARAVVTGAGDDDEDLVVNYLRRNNQVSEGDVVITSGLDGVFPKGIPVGSISRVEDPGRGLFLEASVRPRAKFSYLEEVLVLSSIGLAP